MVAAVGEAGVGKSRLAYEFIHSHRTREWLVLEAASASYGKATPYFPVVDLPNAMATSRTVTSRERSGPG